MSVAGSIRRELPVKATRSRSVARAQLGAVRDRQGEHVAVVQRARLLAGAVRAVDKYGYAHATVSEITALAHVSRRTFYELFAGSEECLLVMFEEVLGRASAQVAAAELDGLAWRERVRGGLWAILCFLDAEPVLARVAVVESAKGGPQIAELRERVFAQLADILDEGRSAGPRVADCPQLTAEGLVGAVLSILHTRLVRGTLKGTPHRGGHASEQQPLQSLQSELM
ncbi:MAG: TetR/AcrR family transcriptional regulator, partial [Solirubrobacteraceae bacterium]